MIKNFVYLAIFTTFVVGVWIGLSIFHNYTSSTISQATAIQISPIDSTFNLQIVEGLKKRKQVAGDLSQSIIIADSEEASTSAEDSIQTLFETPTSPTQATPTPTIPDGLF